MLPQKVRQLLYILKFRDNLDPHRHFFEVVRMELCLSGIDDLLKLLLAHGRAEFFCGFFDEVVILDKRYIFQMT